MAETRCIRLTALLSENIQSQARLLVELNALNKAFIAKMEEVDAEFVAAFLLKAVKRFSSGQISDSLASFKKNHDEAVKRVRIILTQIDIKFVTQELEFIKDLYNGLLINAEKNMIISENDLEDLINNVAEKKREMIEAHITSKKNMTDDALIKNRTENADALALM